MGVSKNRGTPKSSILIGFFIINHLFLGTPIFGNTQMLALSIHYSTSWLNFVYHMLVVLSLHSTSYILLVAPLS